MFRGASYHRFLGFNDSSVLVPEAAVVDDLSKNYSLIRGICQGLVNGAKLIIHYQSAGKQKSHQLYQIAGAALQ